MLDPDGGSRVKLPSPPKTKRRNSSNGLLVRGESVQDVGKIAKSRSCDTNMFSLICEGDDLAVNIHWGYSFVIVCLILCRKIAIGLQLRFLRTKSNKVSSTVVKREIKKILEVVDVV